MSTYICNISTAVPIQCAYSPQDESFYGIRMFLGVGQREGGAPATTHHHPLGHTKMFPQLLQVWDKIPGSVVLCAEEVLKTVNEKSMLHILQDI